MITVASDLNAGREPQRRVQIQLETDPVVLAIARAQDLRFAKNSAWLQARQADIYAQHRGRFICVAGEELFVADDSRSAAALGETAHPEDDGQLVRYIPRKKGQRIYANQRTVATVRR